MKPQWKNAPQWANYLAQDRDCQWWWYATKPRKLGIAYFPTSGDAECVEHKNDYWKSTLEHRPFKNNKRYEPHSAK
jgi:hypothetical protein